MVLHIFLALRNNYIHLSVSIKISEVFCDCFRFCICCIFPGRTPDDRHIPWGTKQNRAAPAVLQQHTKWTWSQEKMGRQEGRQEPQSGWDMSHCFFFMLLTATCEVIALTRCQCATGRRGTRGIHASEAQLSLVLLVFNAKVCFKVWHSRKLLKNTLGFCIN